MASFGCHFFQLVGGAVYVGELHCLSEPGDVDEVAAHFGGAASVHHLEELFVARAAGIGEVFGRGGRFHVFGVEHIFEVGVVEHLFEPFFATVVVEDFLAVFHHDVPVFITFDPVGVSIHQCFRACGGALFCGFAGFRFTVILPVGGAEGIGCAGVVGGCGRGFVGLGGACGVLLAGRGVTGYHYC